METDRVILHSDMNSFYASVEMMLNPALKGKPVAVCGSTEERHGIVLAKSDLAKKAGVKTGMVNWEARQLCPGLIVVPPQYDQYLKYSKLAHQIYHRYIGLVEPFGMDECWLDVSGSGIYGTGLEIAEAIRQTTKDELGLTVSIGVSFNKILAKLGSDMKKPDAITEIKHDDFKERIWPLDAAELLYVGRATEAKLSKYGIHTIGDVARTSPETLQHLLGVNGLKLWRCVCDHFIRMLHELQEAQGGPNKFFVRLPGLNRERQAYRTISFAFLASPLWQSDNSVELFSPPPLDRRQKICYSNQAFKRISRGRAVW